jgi:cobalt-zinc-cadmium efflux system protein
VLSSAGVGEKNGAAAEHAHDHAHGEGHAHDAAHDHAQDAAHDHDHHGHAHDAAHDAGHDHDHDHDHDHHGHAHDHPHDAHSDAGQPAHLRPDAKAASKLPYVLVATFGFFVVELLASFAAQSRALRADAIHLLADVFAIGIAYTAFRLADRRPSARFTFGLRRIEAVAALVNSVLVLLGATEIIHEGVEALHDGAAPRPGVMLAVSAAALVVHGLNATLLHRDLHGHGHAHASPHVHGGPGPRLHVHGAWLHVMGDALGALFALVAAIAIRLGASPRVDPIASFGVAALLVVGGARLIRDASLVLMEAAPAHLPIDAIEATVCGVAGVSCVHRLRVWSLGTGYDAIALHVSSSGSADLSLAAKVERALKARFHVDYVCVQVDPPDA